MHWRPPPPCLHLSSSKLVRSQYRRKNMSFALYLIGFLIFLAGVAWGASVAGVPTLYIAIGALILLGIGIFSAVGRTRSKDPS
jgi:hypothetical protein